MTVFDKILEPATGKFRTKKRIYTVWLIFFNQVDWKMFNCPDCRNPIFQYKGDIVMEVPGQHKQSKYPIMIQCKNANCGRKVLVEGVAKRDE